MSIILGDVTLPNPNEYNSTGEVKGDYTQTLDGTRRRAIQAVKNIYVLGYSRLTTDQYDEIQDEFDLETPRDFVWSDLGIDTSVHIDLSERTFTPGNPNFVSNVIVTLREV